MNLSYDNMNDKGARAQPKMSKPQLKMIKLEITGCCL